MHLIRHGRTVCVARGPRCDRCPLIGLCNDGQRFLARAS
jgi:endonuclease III